MNPLHATPHYGIFETSDGEYLVIGIAHEDPFWNNLCDALGMEDARGMNLAQRIMEKEKLVSRMQEIIRSRTIAAWTEILQDKDTPWCPMAGIAEALDDPQVKHRGMVAEVGEGESRLRVIGSPYKLSLTPPRLESPPPALGEHTEALLREVGFAPEEIAKMREEGAVA